MNILAWLFGKGIARAISTDLLIKYLAIKSQHPNEDNDKLLERVWNFWITLNKENIIEEKDEHKIIRLNIIEEKHLKKTELASFSKCKSLFDLYQDILYIETEVSSTDGKIWDSAMKIFIKESSNSGLDFSKDYSAYKRIMNR